MSAVERVEAAIDLVPTDGTKRPPLNYSQCTLMLLEQAFAATHPDVAATLGRLRADMERNIPNLRPLPDVGPAAKRAA